LSDKTGQTLTMHRYTEPTNNVAHNNDLT